MLGGETSHGNPTLIRAPDPGGGDDCSPHNSPCLAILSADTVWYLAALRTNPGLWRALCSPGNQR